MNFIVDLESWYVIADSPYNYGDMQKELLDAVRKIRSGALRIVHPEFLSSSRAGAHYLFEEYDRVTPYNNGSRNAVVTMHVIRSPQEHLVGTRIAIRSGKGYSSTLFMGDKTIEGTVLKHFKELHKTNKII